MTTVLLARHGLTAMTGPVLAGWTPASTSTRRARRRPRRWPYGWRR
ncbi:hypothetical protein [Nonomuraea recticatena]